MTNGTGEAPIRMTGKGGIRYRHPGRVGFPQQFNLRRRQAAGLFDEVAERVLQFHGFGGEDVGRRAGAGVLIPNPESAGLHFDLPCQISVNSGN
jgi:hypothetical protein